MCCKENPISMAHRLELEEGGGWYFHATTTQEMYFFDPGEYQLAVTCTILGRDGEATESRVVELKHTFEGGKIYKLKHDMPTPEVLCPLSIEEAK